MAITVVSICNMALAHIGSSIPISSLNEASAEARMCNLFYEQTRDKVLREFPWKFAKKEASLQDVGTPPPNWAYRYRYPADCLMARRIVPGVEFAAADQRIPFTVLEDAAAGAKAIATNEPSAVLEYTCRIEDPTVFDSLFISALGWALAAELGIPLSVKSDLVNLAYRMFNTEMAKAMMQSLNEGHEGPAPDSESIRCRS